MRRTRLAFVLLAALASAAAGACGSSSPFRYIKEEDQKIMAVHLENAAQYYDSEHYDRAIQQWEKVLEIDPKSDKARLGTAMALYQLGREESPRGVQRLAMAEEKLSELRDGEIGEMSWKADLGYALTQQRWAELYDRKLTRLEAAAAAGNVDAAELAKVRAERPRRIQLAETTFRMVLADKRTEPNFHLSCWLGLARMAALRGDWEGALVHARKYEAKIVESKEFWKKQGSEYSTRLFGAELQEAELRDVMANCLYKAGRHEEAEAELGRLIDVQPARASAYLNRGMMRYRRAAWDLARADLRRFLELSDLGPTDPVTLEASKALVVAEERVAEDEDRP